MPYKKGEIPAGMDAMPEGLVNQWVAVFNQVVADGGDENDARRMAWGAVKRTWTKNDAGEWMRKDDMSNALEGVEVLRTGTHTSSSGEDVTFGVEDLEALASGYDPETHEAPVVIGHPQNDSPAYGWVRRLRVVGDRLLADMHVIPEFFEWVKKGLWKKRSVSLATGADGVRYLRHVGFLGAVPPAVKGLADVKWCDMTLRVVEFVEVNEMSWRDKAKQFFGMAVDEIPESINADADRQAGEGGDGKIVFTEADLERVQNEAARAVKAQMELEFAARDKARQLELHLEKVKDKISRLVESRKVLPAWVDAGLVEFASGLTWENDCDFGEGGGKKSPFAWFIEFIERLPVSLPTGEVAGKASDPGSDANPGRTLSRLVGEKMRENGSLTYSEAFNAVQLEHPELTVAYRRSIGGSRDGD
jgi:cation transport regulator ChaB